MGFFLDGEIETIRISKMILHIVGESDFDPQPEQEINHAPFFIDRIRDTDAAPVHVFDQRSETKSNLEEISVDGNKFEAFSQVISEEFSRLHVGSSTDGAFFIFELLTNDPTVKIYSLIKYDFREALEQTDGDQGTVLRRIVNAFIADRKAIQKSALVRVINGVAENSISARDRMKTSPDIGDYFATFLNASRDRNDEELNIALANMLRGIFVSLKKVLPDLDASAALWHAKSHLRDRPEINGNAITDAILAATGHPEDEKTRSMIQNKSDQGIRTAKLDGLTFTPNRRVLNKAPMRKVKTVEGVTMYYPDEADGATVIRSQNDDGGERITIETQRVTEDRLVPNSTRGIS